MKDADPNCKVCKGKGFEYVDGWAEDCECRELQIYLETND